ncbi:nuclear receptor subfamily 0, group B, member 2b [Clarias gariepinus]|uniref:nuclear receptor subfamily 0, group B, member 2b n=1 Tax=Clarias gariepinus TaxID=13013 RepID=UPI00234DE6E2|nr:nuclear receptor subfamily 0, group B, member 2b [Clarias gariepinus]
MYSPEEPRKDYYPMKLDERCSNTILFNILNRTAMTHSCHCENRRLVRLRNPDSTCHAAAEVLLRTICFMKSLPSFHQLPELDQCLLMRSQWVPLFILGLAQERITVEVTDFPTTSFLHKILSHDQNKDREQETEDVPLNLAAVNNLKSCLDRLWRLDLTAEEYAYLKGSFLFSPDVPGLINSRLIEELQKEAQCLLHGVVDERHPRDPRRFRAVLLAASSLHTVGQNFVTDLFFRRVIGQTDLLELLTEMLFSTGCF